MGYGSVNPVQEKPFVPHELAATELVARFIYSSSQMSKTNGRIKTSAFNPSPYDELSVVHSTGLSDSEVWNIGLLTLTTEPGRRTIYGRANIPVAALVEQALKAILDNKPFSRHTSVVGWPKSSNENEQKELRKAICLELSQNPAIKLVVPESPLIRT